MLNYYTLLHNIQYMWEWTKDIHSGIHLCSLHLNVYLPNSCVTAHWCVWIKNSVSLFLLFLLVTFIRADSRCCSGANTIITVHSSSQNTDSGMMSFDTLWRDEGIIACFVEIIKQLVYPVIHLRLLKSNVLTLWHSLEAFLASVWMHFKAPM